MRRTYSATRNALLTSAGPTWGAGALAFAVLALLARLIAPGAFLYAARPMLAIGNDLSAAGERVYSAFADTATLAAKNQKLFEENSALAAENRALLAELADVRGLGSPDASAKSPAPLIAGVVSRPPTSAYDTLVAAAGRADGVFAGMEAFGAGGVPLGTVSAVTDSFSRVALFSSPQMRTQGWIGAHRIPVTIAGEGAGSFSASVSRDAQVAAGDAVYVPGPGALPIGTVARIDGDAAAPTETLRIAPAVNPFSITWVMLRDTGATFAASATSTP
ncbi:MAG TPA: rod shape-determining protein MreC [Candidatus Paceibacterota bacterium]|nr:rod shape-determining protein MreC [Candidatus Paceibacterota bacterium]